VYARRASHCEKGGGGVEGRKGCHGLETSRQREAKEGHFRAGDVGNEGRNGNMGRTNAGTLRLDLDRSGRAVRREDV